MIWIILIRLISSSFILKMPFWGGILAIVLDFFDLGLLTLWDLANITKYQQMDKILDLYYLTLEAYISTSWKNQLVKWLALVFFIYRVVGVTLFDLHPNEKLLIYFPNIFELFYLSYLLGLKLFKKDKFVKAVSLVPLLITIFLFKLAHEYLLHVNTYHPWSENPYVKTILFWKR